MILFNRLLYNDWLQYPSFGGVSFARRTSWLVAALVSTLFNVARPRITNTQIIFDFILHRRAM